MESEQKAVDLIGRLHSEIGPIGDWLFFIPGWDAVQSGQAEHWIRAMIYEGFYVAYRVDAEHHRVDLKHWEYGEDEPTWSACGPAT